MGGGWRLREELGFPGGSEVKNPPANAGDVGSIPGLGRSPGERNGSPLQYSCLGNPMDRGAWRAGVRGVAKGIDLTREGLAPWLNGGEWTQGKLCLTPGNPLQYSCLENPMDRGVWQATVRGVLRVGHD